jgi:hypothetical protein
MRLYALSGQRYQALRQYEWLVQALGRELDAEPEAESRRLYEEILAGRTPTAIEPLPAGGEPAELPGAAGRHNLPDTLSSFVGREREVIEVARLLGALRLQRVSGLVSEDGKFLGPVSLRIAEHFEQGHYHPGAHVSLRYDVRVRESRRTQPNVLHRFIQKARLSDRILGEERSARRVARRHSHSGFGFDPLARTDQS